MSALSVDIVLLNPPSTASRIFRSEHLGLGYLAATLRQEEYNVAIVDADLYGLSVPQVEEAILALGHPKAIGVSITDPSGFETTSRILKTLRSKGVRSHTTVGGYVPTFWYDAVLADCPEIDSVVLGEGEKPILELVQSLTTEGRDWHTVRGMAFPSEGQVATCGPRRLVEDLDSLPFPSRDHLPYAYEHHFVASVAASRGCYHRCTFCQITEFYRLSDGTLWRVRSPESIVEEMAMLERDYGVRHILFVDDDFVGAGDRGRLRAHAIADEMVRRGIRSTFTMGTRVDGVDRELLAHLQQAGLVSVFLGIESCVERALRDYAKGIDPVGISAAISTIMDLGLVLRPLYIAVDAFTTLEEIGQTFRFFRDTPSAIPVDIHDLDVLRGTRLEETYRRANLLVKAQTPLSLAYRHVHREAHLFSDLLAPGYRRIYHPVCAELYRLYYLYGHFDGGEREGLRPDLAHVVDKLGTMHLRFLESAIRVLEAGVDIDVDAFLAPLADEGREAYAAAQGEVEAWLLRLGKGSAAHAGE